MIEVDTWEVVRDMVDGLLPELTPYANGSHVASNNAFANGRWQASLRGLACAVQRGRSSSASSAVNACPALIDRRSFQHGRAVALHRHFGIQPIHAPAFHADGQDRGAGKVHGSHAHQYPRRTNDFDDVITRGNLDVGYRVNNCSGV